MKIENSFEVDSPIDRTWDALTDLERIAPCMPGAQLREIDGEDYKGSVKVKVGPITQSFDGVARFVELDRSHYRAVISAAGREQRGQGTASATITTALESVGTGTRVSIETDLAITGRAAQFGRSLLQDVSMMLLKQFVQRLESDVLAAPETTPPPVPAGAAATAVDPAAGQPAASGAQPPATAAARVVTAPPAEPINLAAVSAGSLTRRLVPPAALAAAILAVIGVIDGSWSGGRWLLLAAVLLVSASTAAVAVSRTSG